VTKRVQILGHDHETANAFIGEEREITVDIDNWELRLHDGSTPGGWLIYNRDQNDARYQARSVELDGLLGWEPNERGIVVRIGPAYYKLREIMGNPDNIGVTDGDGHDGQPTITILEVIASDHTATGEWEFTQVIKASAGVLGDLTGDTIGTHTGNVIGDVTGNVTGNLTGDSTGKHTGGLDTRGAEVIMDNGQIEVAWINGFNAAVNQVGVPIGAITPYWGAIGDIPENWFICDGTNGTPDLRDRFMVGAGVNFIVNSGGGTLNHTHGVSIDSGGAHTHTGSTSPVTLTIAQMPAHKHANGVTDSGTDLFSRGTTAAAVVTPDSIDNNSNNGTIEGWTSTEGGGEAHSHLLTVDSGGSHTHSGDTTPGSSIPPYFALLYIMRGS
jgi:hypothetical protein